MITRSSLRLVWLVCLMFCFGPGGAPPAGLPATSRSSAGLVLLAEADMNANRLYEDLMMTYNRLMKPTRTASEKLTVRLGLKLSQLMEVNLKNQMMTIYLWLNQEWFDYKLRWDPSEYGNITDIDLPAEQIWLPDIVLYNSAEGHFAVSIMTKAKVSHDGYVVWNPPAIFRSSCQIDITHFPFDTQNCYLKFGSWTYGDRIDLRHVNESLPPIDAGADLSNPPGRLDEPQRQLNASSPTTEAAPASDSGQINESSVTIDRGTDLSEYYQNVEWDIMEASAKRNTIKYACCPESYNDVTFHYKLRRKPLFYTVNLIVPCVGITFFSFLVFYLPSDSGEKVTLTISILVSLIFFLSVLIETIPSTSLVMPLLGKYLVFTMILINMSVCATVGVLNIHFRTPSTHSMSPWVKRWCMDILPKYLFMSVPQYQQTSSNILPEQLIYLHNPAYAARAVSLPLNQPSNPIGANPNKLPERPAPAPAQALGRGGMACCPEASFGGAGHVPSHGRNHATSMMTLTSDPRDTTAKYRGNSHTGHLHELNAASLLTENNPAQPMPHAASFLPHLQSEAARRLQMQRSRSSERDTRSLGENQPSLSTGANQPAGERGRDEMKLDARPPGARSEPVQADKVAKVKAAKGAPLNPIWRLFRSNKDQATDANETESSRAQQGQQRLSHSSTTSSNSVARYEEHDDDEYEHHRHFQARASICSNNLWRIGPTRRCSLAVPMNNYPTYYRPLAQFYHHRGSGAGASSLNTISGPSCLPPIVAHYHLHGEDSEMTTTSASSEDTVRYRDGATIGRLVSHATSLVRPGCSPEQQSRPISERGEPMRELVSLTSGGFVANGAQQHRGINAVPPRRSVSPLSQNSESQADLPTPPPPLPPPSDFPDSSAERQHSSQTYSFGGSLGQVGLGPASLSAQMQAPFYDQSSQGDQSEREHRLPLPTAAMLQRAELFAPPPRPQYHSDHAQAQAGGKNPTRPQQYVQAGPIQQSYLINKLGPPNALPGPQPRDGAVSALVQGDFHSIANQYLHTSNQHHQHHQQQQLSMPRSRSSDHRLFGLTQDQSRSGTILAGLVHNAYQQQQRRRFEEPDEGGISIHRAPPPDLMGQQHQSIGRRLGQAYIQRLQRQPAVLSLQHQARVPLTLGRNVGPINVQQRDSRYGELITGRAHFAQEPSIEMLRRSKSQTSLNRRAHGGIGSAPTADCRHCNLACAGPNHSDYPPATNQTPAGLHCIHRPQSGMRARVHSASNHSNPRPERCPMNSTQWQACPISHNEPVAGCEISRRTPASLKTMPPGQAGNHCIDDSRNKSCCCAEQKSSARKLAGSRVNVPAQPAGSISKLSLLKLINEVDKAIQNAMFIAQHIDNLDEFESVKENWKYIAMVIDRICLIMFLFFCIFGTVIIFSMVPWTYYLKERPIDLDLMRMQALNLTSCDTLKQACR